MSVTVSLSMREELSALVGEASASESAIDVKETRDISVPARTENELVI